MPKINQLVRYLNKGFTLVEVIIGIVVLSLSFTIITGVILPATEQSANQIHQIRAAELGQSMLNEILGKAFDENSDMVGGVTRCGESATTCTLPAALGNEEGNDRLLFDDVDDYHDLDQGAGSVGNNLLQDSLGNNLSDRYPNFRVEVDVVYDGNYNGSTDGAISLAKRIDVKVSIVSAGKSEPFVFSAYKANF